MKQETQQALDRQECYYYYERHASAIMLMRQNMTKTSNRVFLPVIIINL